MIETPSKQPKDSEFIGIILRAQNMLDAYECADCTDEDITQEVESAVESLRDGLNIHINSCGKGTVCKLQHLVERLAVLFGEHFSIQMTLLKINSTLEVRLDRILQEEVLMREEEEAAKITTQAS